MAKQALHDRVDHDTMYHRVGDKPAPDTPVTARMAQLRELTNQLGHAAVDNCPEGRELSLALTKLVDEFLPMAIAAIARNQDAVMADAMSRGQA